MLIRHLSLRLLFTSVAIDTNDECLVLAIIFSAVFFLNYNDKKRLYNNSDWWFIVTMKDIINNIVNLVVYYTAT